MIVERFLRVNESDFSVRPMYKTPCCGALHYEFLDEPRMCHLCGGDLSGAPVVFVQEKDLTHLRFQAVSRYVS